MVQKNKSITINFVMNFILTISTFIFPLITFPYVSRVLSPVGIGRINFVTAVVTYFMMFGMLGIPTYGIRAVAKVRDDQKLLAKTVQEILIINSIAMLFVSIIYVIAIFTVPKFNQDFTLFVINGTLLFLNVIGIEWLYKGLEEYRYITIRSIFFKLISVILMFIYVRSKEDYIKYGIINIFATAGSNVYNFINIRKYSTLRYRGKYDFKQHLPSIFRFFMMSIAATIYTHLDTVMIGFMKGDYDVGYYTAAVKSKTILTSLVTSLGAVLLPRLSYYIEKNERNKFNDLAIKSFNFIIWLAIPITVFFILNAKETILILSGETFIDAVIPMQVIMPTVLLIGISNLLGIQILVPLQRENEVLRSVALGAVVNLIFNAIFIPMLGATGAAIGTLIAELIVVIYQIYVLSDTFSLLMIHQKWNALLLANIGAFLAAIFMNYFIMPKLLIVKMIMNAMVFFGVYGVILLIMKENMTMNILLKIFTKLVKKDRGV
ncbi:flippase [Aerococcaceae bacterium zg-ZUI334]|uniref:flippase n=1 Tax=Aerococcaceae bacterium zg-252 TaxID=2796928 RepID=UPI001B90602F|nr:flippase [Aerococcaceae bacterium zg-ZUI334]